MNRNSISILRDGAGTALIRLGSLLANLLLSVVLARTLGAQDYGVYAYTLAWVALLGLPLHSGLSTLIIREVARYRVDSRWAQVRGLLKRALQLTGLVTVFVALMVTFFSVFNPASFDASQLLAISLGAVLIPLGAVLGVYGAMLVGSGSISLGQLAESLYRPSLLLTLLLAVRYASPIRLSPNTALLLNIVAGLLATGIAVVYFRTHIRPRLAGVTASFETRRWLASILPLAFFGATTMIMGQTDLLILGFYESSAVVGVYKIATIGSTLAAFGLQIVNVTYAPRYAQAYAKKDFSGLQKLAAGGARFALGVAIVVVLAYALFGKIILGVVFGETFIAAYAVLLVLSAGHLFSSGMGSVGLILNMSHFEKNAALAVALAALVNIVSNFVLIPIWGAMGAALSTAGSLVLWNLLMWRMTRVRLGIDVSAAGLSRVAV